MSRDGAGPPASPMAAASRAPRGAVPATQVVVRTYSHVVEAELALGHLHSLEIPAALKDVHTLSVAGHLTGAMGGIKLVVPEEAAERAQQALDDVQVVANGDDDDAGGPAPDGDDGEPSGGVPMAAGPRVRHRGASVAVRAGLLVLVMGRVLVGGTGNGARLEGAAVLMAMALGWRRGRQQRVMGCGVCGADVRAEAAACPRCGCRSELPLRAGA